MATDWVTTAAGVRRCILVDVDKLMLTEVHFEPGAVVAAHSHPHEQATFVVKGRVRFTVGDTAQEYAAGDAIYIPSGVAHAVIALEESLLLDTFSLPREDFRKKD
jgi:quercetin dioxygenase-like cupin family protein